MGLPGVPGAPGQARAAAAAFRSRRRLLGEREDERLLGGVHGHGIRVATLCEELQHALDQLLGHARTRGHADLADTLEPGLVDLGGVVHAVRRLGAGLQGDLDQANGVGGVAGPDDDQEVGVLRDLLDRQLAVLGGVADVVAGRVEQQGNRCRIAATVSRVSSTDSVVCDSQATRAGSRTSMPATSAGPWTSWMWSSASPAGPLDLLVAGVPDQEDVVVLVREPLRLVVHLGHQRAGRVDGLQRARPPAGGPPARRHEREDDRAPSGTSSSSSTKMAPGTRGPPPRACCARSACARRPGRRTGPAPAPPSPRRGRPRRSSRAARPAGRPSRRRRRQDLRGAQVGRHAPQSRWCHRRRLISPPWPSRPPRSHRPR